MDSEKDRWGDKLRDLEQAREDQYFAKRDRELLEKLRASEEAETISCPRCSSKLERVEEGPLRALVCAAGHGSWFDADALATLGDPERRAAFERLLSRLGGG